MSSSDRTTLGFDVLLAAVPFGLFDAEDLVVVEAARQLAAREGASPAERQMLAWYFGEQGSYAKARDLIAGDTAITQIVRKRLKRIGQLDARFIRHSARRATATATSRCSRSASPSSSPARTR